MTEPVFERLAIIGFGLIGSSVARVVRERGLAAHIVACDASESARQTIHKLGLADTVTFDVAEAATDADCVMIAVPVGQFEAIGQLVAPVLKKGAIVTDTGSVKEAVIRDLGPFIPEGVHFIPAHPIAGTEKSGPESGFAELFTGRWCILTPPPGTDGASVDKVAALWSGMGSTIQIMTATHHDKVLAITSHLPHLISYAIVGTATDLERHTKAEVIKFSAGGFRDFTRLAASDPIMWRDIFLNNREAVLEMLQRLNEDISALQRAIRWGEGEVLEEMFTRTRTVRRSVVKAKQA
ncbi:MAG: prephenate/arogenate dehydrogenase family protein [Pseudomonadota bacterium]|nr:prephenate/arogenate dehydrogenase family protein [Pseudomonadota bacterium]